MRPFRIFCLVFILLLHRMLNDRVVFNYLVRVVRRVNVNDLIRILPFLFIVDLKILQGFLHQPDPKPYS